MHPCHSVGCAHNDSSCLRQPATQAVMVVIAATAMAVAVPSARADIILDWELGALAPLAAGQIIDDEYASMGVHVSALNSVAGHPNLAVIFDTDNPTGGDLDLATPGYHPTNTVGYQNVLIIPERGSNVGGVLSAAPDDEAGGGSLLFDLDFTATSVSLALIDIEETGGTIDFFDGGIFVGSVSLTALGDNSVQSFFFGAAEFDSFSINLAGSGAVAEIIVKQIPVPGAFAALGMLGVARLTGRGRRRCG